MRQVLGPGALGKPRRNGWRGRWEGGLGWGTHVNPWLFHFNVWQNPPQIKKKKKKESPSGKYFGSFAIVQHRLPGILRESPPAYSVAPRWWGICPDLGLPWRLKTVKNLLSGQERLRFNPWVGKISGEGNGNPLQYSCLENPCGWRSLVGYSPWCHKRVGHDWATNTPNPIQTHCMRRPVAPYPCKTLDVFILVILAILMSILQHLIEVLVCISC